MLTVTTLVQALALLPAIASAAEKFDYDSLSLREVGARNTVVSHQPVRALVLLLDSCCLMSCIGLARVAGEGRRADLFLARHPSLR